MLKLLEYSYEVVCRGNFGCRKAELGFLARYLATSILNNGILFYIYDDSRRVSVGGESHGFVLFLYVSLNTLLRIVFYSGEDFAAMRLDVKRQLFARSERVKGIDFHPTEPWILTTLYSGHVYIWSFETQVGAIFAISPCSDSQLNFSGHCQNLRADRRPCSRWAIRRSQELDCLRL